MKYFHPILHLLCRIHLDEPREYCLQAVTFCDRTQHRAQGHFELPHTLDENGFWCIDLKIGRDIELPDFESITPVVHTIELGPSPSESDDFDIKVNVILLNGSGRETNKKKPKPAGSSVVKSTDADEDSRPLNKQGEALFITQLQELINQ